MLKIKSFFSMILAVIITFFSTFYCNNIIKPQSATLPVELVRDGTPKKYFTLSFDDGITQDLKIMEILKKYNVHCCTFNINTGLCGESWDWVGEISGNPNVKHQRFTKKELKSGIYDGFDVEVHTLHHVSMMCYDDDAFNLRREVENDAYNIYKITGIKPLGMAWPGGDTEYTDKTIEQVLKYTSIRFARGTTGTLSFDLPQYFMKWLPTTTILDSRAVELTKQFIEAPCSKDMLLYLWGHGYEFDLVGSYDRLEEILKLITKEKDIVCVTNAEFYLLFKNEIPSWK